HHLALPELRASLDDFSRYSPRHARLRHLLDDYIPANTESELEAAFLDLCAKYRLALPETQVTIGAYRVDFLWRDLRLVVETDGRDAHDGYIAFRDDRIREIGRASGRERAEVGARARAEAKQ